MTVSIVGIGMDGRATLTAEAKNAVETADLLIGAERMLEPFSGLGKRTVSLTRAEEIAALLGETDCGAAAVLMSGDVGFYSGAKKLLPLIRSLPSVTDCGIICGISSPVYLSAKLGLAWERMKPVSLHGLDGNVAVNVRLNEFTFFLLGGRMTPSAVCELLCEYGLGEVTVSVGERLGYPDEKIVTDTAANLRGSSFGYLCCVIIRNENCLRHIPSAIPDGEFIRSEVPMTKSEIRGLAVSMLNVCADSVCWDVGSGTGSVSVEMAFRCPEGKVIAVEQKPEAAELTAANARKFGCDNIRVVSGAAPEALAGLPRPDRVFIGGSSGNLAEIGEVIRGANPDALVIVTAVSLETLREASELLGDCEITQLSAARTRKLGSHTMLTAQNPVFIIKGRFR